MKANQLAAVVCLMLIVGCQSPTQSPKPRPSQEELRQTSHEWDKFFNSGDAAKIASLYADDVVSMPPNSPTLSGRGALQADFETFFAKNVARHETMVDKIVIEGDLAIEVARYRLTYSPRVGGAEIVETGRHMETRRNIDGRWKIILEIWNSDSPAPK